MENNEGSGPVKGKLAVITGGGGVICSTLALGLAREGIRTVILDIDEDAAKAVASEITRETGCFSVGLAADVLNRSSVESVAEQIQLLYGHPHYLVNGAGGNRPEATTSLDELPSGFGSEEKGSFFDLDIEGFRRVFDLNFLGTVIPSMVFGRGMVTLGRGAILNVSSLNADRPLTRIPAYSAAKASVNNFTAWLAVHFAKTGVRVNAICPGFLLTHQNRFLLTSEKTGELTSRGKKILGMTPMGRFGVPEELTGAAGFLLSDRARFITGQVLVVDGGFSAYSGV